MYIFSLLLVKFALFNKVGKPSTFESLLYWSILGVQLLPFTTALWSP